MRATTLVSVLSIRGERVADARAYTPGSEPPGDRPETAAVATWTPGAWTGGSSYRTADFKNVVQELVDQPGWTPGNAMAFVIRGTGLRKAAGDKRLQGQYLSQYKAEQKQMSEADRIRDLERQLEEAKERERRYESDLQLRAEIR